MAIYHFSARIIKRSEGRSAVAAAAYRAADALHDEAAGRTYNYLAKPDVIHSEILLPAGAPSRWCDRAVLWNETEARERQHNSQLARDIELALPKELSRAEAIQLVRAFAQKEFIARGMVADVNIHWGQAADGTPQPHAHIMLSMRRVVPGPEGHPEEAAFGLKEPAWNDRVLLQSWRAAWADLVNARLDAAGFDVRVDHRSNAARGIDLEPQHKIGPAGARRAVRGEDAERAGEHRAIARRNGERLLAEPGLALQALTQQQSTFTRADLARLVHRHSDGAAQFAAIMAKVEAAAELVTVGQDPRGRARYSTREMLAIERRMEAAALDLSRRTTHAVAAERRRTMLGGSTLGAEQRLAFGHVTRSRDLAVVVGFAGTGKSTMLGAARPAWETEGYTVRGAALSGIAAEELQAGSGIASRTIASWEHAWARDRERLGPRDILVLDEAGMVGSRQMERVLGAVRDAGAKLVLVGDHEQLQAIEAGAAFRAIAERVGAVEITEVRRQHAPWQRAATQELATGRTQAALSRYRDAGMVHAHATDDAALAAVIDEWQAERLKAPERSRIILAHTRDDVRRANGMARGKRRNAGELGEDHVLPTELGERSLAVGDRIYFLRNERGLGGPDGGVKNGTLGTVTPIAGDGEGARLTVQLDRTDGATGRATVVSFLLAEYAHIDHGYAATVHKNQGVTVDHAHVLATPGMDRHLAYVAMTRHRHGLTLHWSREAFGSAENFAGRLSRERAKDTTLDYGESEAELCAAYAGRRGLNPLAPVSEIVVRPAASTEMGDRHEVQDAPRLGLARRNLQRAQFTHVLQPVLLALRQAVEQQKMVLAAIAEVLTRPGQPNLAAPQKPAAEPYADADFGVLTGMEPPPSRRRPQDHVTEGPAAIKPPPPAPGADAPASSPAAPLSASLPKSGKTRRVVRKPKPALVPPVPSPPQWPWAGLDPTPPAAPLLRAARPVSVPAFQAYEAVHSAAGGERRHLEQRYEQVYRDPQEASARFALLKAEIGIEAARDRVAREPGSLGPLRGGWLTADGREMRAQALGSGRAIVDDDQNLRRVEQEAWQHCQAAEEQRREQAAIEVPGLSAKAQAAVRALADGEARPGWTPPELSKDRNPTPEGIVAMAQCARLYEAVLADSPLLAELNRFETAAADRLGYGGQVGSPGSSQTPDAERQARRFLGVLVAIRAFHDWYPVLQDHVAAHPKLKARVEHAESMLLLAGHRADHGRSAGPKPSPGPSFGPGM